MAERTTSLRQEQLRFANDLRSEQRSWGEVARAFRDRYHVNARVALRLARGWSQGQAADRWNERWPAEPKTFKSFSYWENWPGRTGYAPSLDVLARLAELYECHIADLLADCADFSHRDTARATRNRLVEIQDLANGAESNGATNQPSGPLAAMTDRLAELDVHELAELGAAWAQQLDSSLDRRALLLKLSASLALAAATPPLADVDQPEMTSPALSEGGSLAGIWHSRYSYASSGRAATFEGEHYVVLRHQAGRILGQSLPHTMDSRLRLEMSVAGSIATGSWSERTSPTGYYAGSIYHGTLQFLVDPMNMSLSGRWLGFGKGYSVNTGEWNLTLVARSATKREMRQYHLKA